MLANVCSRKEEFKISAKDTKSFWRNSSKWNMVLEPDILLQFKGTNYIIDTKWKYQQKSSIEDIRQMYTYGIFWHAKERFLIYPDNVVPNIIVSKGYFFDPTNGKILDNDLCSLVKVNLINEDYSLNKKIGNEILNHLFNLED